MENKIEPCVTIIFGATGDLTNRKLLPALYKLELENLLHKDSKIIAFARKPKSNDEFRSDVLKAIKKFTKFKINNKVWKRLSNKFFYHKSEFQGVAPTGKQFTITAIAIDRVSEGKIVERWINFDVLSLMQQIGALPSPGNI